MGDPAVLIYSTTTCGWCARARRLFAAKGVAFSEIDVNAVPGGRDEMRQRSGRTTVPQIFICGQHVGGYDDAQALELRGELDTLLTADCRDTSSDTIRD